MRIYDLNAKCNNNGKNFKVHIFIMFAIYLWLSSATIAHAVDSTDTSEVIGRMPIATEITLSPASPMAGRAVRAAWRYTNQDEDVESGSKIEWLLDGVVVPGQEGTDYILPINSATKRLQVRVTPRSAAPANPNTGAAVTSVETVIAQNIPTACVPGTTLIDNGKTVTCPVTNRDGWGADAYCKALGGRLPTVSELQSIFVNQTTATAVGQLNYEMCQTHGWPLQGYCGGTNNAYWTIESSGPNQNFYVEMVAGGAYGSYWEHTANVTCVL